MNASFEHRLVPSETANFAPVLVPFFHHNLTQQQIFDHGPLVFFFIDGLVTKCHILWHSTGVRYPLKTLFEITDQSKSQSFSSFNRSANLICSTFNKKSFRRLLYHSWRSSDAGLVSVKLLISMNTDFNSENFSRMTQFRIPAVSRSASDNVQGLFWFTQFVNLCPLEIISSKSELSFWSAEEGQRK